MTLFIFFNPHELTKIVLKSRFSTFFRNIQNRERLKGPPFSFFPVFWPFFEKKSQRVPFNLLMFCDRMDVEKSLCFFRHCETFFEKLNVFKWSLSIFSSFATEMLKNRNDLFWRATSIQILGFSGAVKENTWQNTLKSFCYFWALDMAPTWARFVLFSCECYIMWRTAKNHNQKSSRLNLVIYWT